MSDRIFATSQEILIHKNNLRIQSENLKNRELINKVLALASTNSQLKSRHDEEWQEILVEEMHRRFDKE